MLRNNDAITAYAASWGLLDQQPLRVTLRLSNPRAGYDALHLDGMLSYALVLRSLGHSRLAQSVTPYDLPLPLRCLWRDTDGVPLWATTDMQPQGVQAQSTATWTRRPIRPDHVALPNDQPYTFRDSQGPYKAMQIPLPIETAECWTCDVIGDAQRMADLLSVLHAAGKKQAQGWGQIVGWDLDPIPAWHITDAAAQVRRPVPIAACGADPMTAQLLGWSPPYWHCQALCVAPGEVASMPEGWAI